VCTASQTIPFSLMVHFSTIFLHMYASHSYSTSSPRKFKYTMLSYWYIILCDLIVLGCVWIEVILPIPLCLLHNTVYDTHVSIRQISWLLRHTCCRVLQALLSSIVRSHSCKLTPVKYNSVYRFLKQMLAAPHDTL
jgi:hypothetical protein